MMIILQKDVPKLGTVGDIVRVKDGYGRNYLVPRGLALLADTRNVKRLEHQKRQANKVAEAATAEATALAAKIAGTPVTLKVEVGEEGKLFGSITNRDIAAALAAEGVEVDRRNIQLPSAIKGLGVYPVSIQVGSGVEAELKVYVVEG
jgi:large subunit ribosomal protein L9